MYRQYAKCMGFFFTKSPQDTKIHKIQKFVQYLKFLTKFHHFSPILTRDTGKNHLCLKHDLPIHV